MAAINVGEVIIRKRRTLNVTQDDFNEWLHFALKLWSIISRRNAGEFTQPLKPTIKLPAGKINSFHFGV